MTSPEEMQAQDARLYSLLHALVDHLDGATTGPTFTATEGFGMRPGDSPLAPQKSFLLRSLVTRLVYEGEVYSLHLTSYS